MAVQITRKAGAGDARNPRVPFKEPGSAQPMIRLSALAFQGVSGDPVSALTSPEGALALGMGGSGTPARFEYTPSGVPVIGFDASLEGETPVRRPTVYRTSGAGLGIAPKTLLAVVRLVRWPTSTDSTSANESALHITRASIEYSETVCIIRPTAAAASAKRLAMRGGSGSFLYGPEFPDDGELHFVAAVFDGTEGRLYLDNSVTTGAITPPSQRHFVNGYALNGGYYQLAESAHYAEALTPLQIQAKRQHYRALYGF